ncbi:DNA polymerase IV [Oscillatoria sp. FACHB-1407]|uniref:DNA polymerase IV n=1 Tax=Oscillatoria sp. FACHB-1407 TaxID=2692847 RepID=UPI00168411D5|nr:DNA polymerase IV [Oscillatoria sp. FACHB-1407]MBD2461443.1 DNA polymerase IV [Oscillatoria sp. FACHB-1407]
MSTLRKIIHVDMDAFFASVEQRDRPELRGKPIVVGGTPEQRGAVAAASYEARHYGIHSAMPSRVALQRCPHVIFVKPRFDVYRTVSQQIREIFHRYTDLIEPLSLDEAYLDVTQNKRDIPFAITIATEIKQAIVQETQLTASAGVSINKFLAKIASGLNKPNGLTLIAPDRAEAFVEALPIEKFYGVGAATAAKMKDLGIHLGADLKRWSEEALTHHFGKAGHYYYRVARAQDDRPVNPNRIRKSIGAERSFAEDLSDVDLMCDQLKQIAEEVQERMDKHRRYGYTLTLKVKYENYQQITRSRTVNTLLSKADEIRAIAQELLITHLEHDRAVRLLGITISGLVEPTKTVRYVQLAFDLSPSVRQ